MSDVTSDITGSPAADELEELAEAAFWSGRPRETIAAWQRAYARHRDAGDERREALADLPSAVGRLREASERFG